MKIQIKTQLTKYLKQLLYQTKCRTTTKFKNFRVYKPYPSQYVSFNKEEGVDLSWFTSNLRPFEDLSEMDELWEF